jgi:hypothetical protein
MTRRLVAAALTALAVLAVFVVLARAPRPAVAPAVLLRTASGQLIRVSPAAGVHATTQTSPASAGSQTPTLAAAAAPVTPTTRTS